MDAHLFRRFCEDLTPQLAGARIEKLQEPAPGLLALTWYGGGRKRQLCLRHARKEPFCFLSASRITAGKAPSAQIMRLRKYASGRRNIAVSGWQEDSGVVIEDLIRVFEPAGLRHVLTTDISRDGMLQGPNLPSTAEFAAATGLGTIVSGGISSLADLRAARAGYQAPQQRPDKRARRLIRLLGDIDAL